MSSWSFRASFLALMLFALVGCDSNSGGPAAPSSPVENAGANSQGGLKGVPTTTPGPKKEVTGPKPTPID